MVFGKPAVVDVRRDRLLDVHDVVETDAVQLLGGHAGLDVLPDHVQHLGREAAGDAHFFLLFRGLDGDMATHEGVHRVHLRKALF